MTVAPTPTWALATLLAMGACGGDETASSTGAGGGTSCPSGHVEHPSGEGCMPVGIQGCAEMFLEEDGLCHPSRDKCPPGTIPRFAEGCIPVGIPDCAPEFVEADGLCHPSMDKCPAGSFAVPTEGCVSIDGDGCGSGTWGLIADMRGTVWVDPTYAGGNSDGSPVAPFTTIAAALLQAASGARIALAAGDYAEPVTIDRPLELIGRCPSMVTISGTQPTQYTSTPAIVLSEGAAGVRLSGVRLSGAGIGLLAVGGDVELAGVHIREATDVGVLAGFGTLHVTRSLIEGTLPEPASGAFGRGIEVLSGASLDLVQSALVGNRDLALHAALAGTTAMVSESLIEKTLPRESDLERGRGIEVNTGASLDLMESALTENRDVALFAALTGTTVTVSESLIEKTLPQESDLAFGRGINVQEGASLDLMKSALAENRDVALFLSRATVTASESLVEHTLPRESDASSGAGVLCSSTSTLAISGSAIQQNQTAGVFVGFGATAELTGSLLDEVLPGKFHEYEGPPGMQVIVASYEGLGEGLIIAFGSRATVTDTVVRRASRAGVLFESSDGILRGVRSTESRFGLVLQGMPQPDWQHDDNFFDGSEQPILTEGNLPVPDAPPVPEG
jgi:hypothetical protein